MTVTFELKTDPQTLDTPLVNLRNKKFKKMRIDCVDDCDYLFIQDANPLDYPNSVVLLGDNEITLYNEYISFKQNDATVIIPYKSIVRWKIWE